MQIGQFLARFQRVRPVAGGYSTCCPAHEDNRQSLSISRGDDGRILVKCHAGCNTEDVLRAIGLSFKDVMPETSSMPPLNDRPTGRPQIVATYIYVDEGGEPLFRVVRYDNKKFAQQRKAKTGTTGWANGLTDVRRVPYNLDKLCAAPADTFVFIPEGEKDCDNLKKIGLLATTNPGGASAWKTVRDDARRALKAKHVVVLPDNDGPGFKHAQEVANSLLDVAASVRIIELPGLEPKGDVSNWLRSGGSAEQLRELVRQADIIEARQVTEDPEPALNEERCTDLGNAKRFARQHTSAARFVPTWKRWLIWDGKRWNDDTSHEVIRLACQTVQGLFKEADEFDDKDRRDELRRHAMRSESAAKLGAMIKLAEAQPRLCAGSNDFDCDPWQFNCENGVLDLRTGELKQHRPENLITKLSGVPFDPVATCPTWEAFLARVMGGDPDLISFLQRAVGYSMTGDTTEHAMFILHGTGANGKSTFVEVVRAILGDYAKATEQTTFLAKTADTVRNDIAMLRSARMVTTAETEGGRKLDESLVKACTGGDPITARFLYSELFEFVPQFKLFLSTNHKPIIKGSDNGIWRRIKLIPFGVTIPEHERDRSLTAKLRQELPGILRWAVTGCLSWQTEGLQVPAGVRQATEEYRQDMDPIGGFIAERCTLEDRTLTKDLYASYLAWAQDSGEREPCGLRQFTNHLLERGFARTTIYVRRTPQRGWAGIRLREPLFSSLSSPSLQAQESTASTIIDKSHIGVALEGLPETRLAMLAVHAAEANGIPPPTQEAFTFDPDEDNAGALPGWASGED